MSFNLSSITNKKAKLEKSTAANAAAAAGGGGSRNANPYLTTPVDPHRQLSAFLTQCRTAARKYLPKESQKFPITTPYCEVEVRLGILKVPHASPDRRVTSSGAKHVQGKLAQAFDTSQKQCSMVSGVSRSHFSKWTGSGLSELSPISSALGVTDAAKLKHDLVETELVETVYGGYAQDKRVCFPALHPTTTTTTNPPASGGGGQGSSSSSSVIIMGKMESKEKLTVMDLTVPAAPYDIRATLSSEKITDDSIPNHPPPGWKVKRIKRRRSYTRRDRSIKWQIDVTEVTTSNSATPHAQPTVDYEIELELLEKEMLNLVNVEDSNQLQKMAHDYSRQLWWILTQLNPLADALDVEEGLRDHPDKQAVQLALAQCGALKRFLDSGGKSFDSPIGKPGPPPAAALSNLKFIGCMPVSFSRHHLDEIQRANDSYFLSEKTDGVRHLMVFTGTTVVLVDRAQRGKTQMSDAKQDPFTSILPLIQPGTVLDGEVVMNRGRSGGPNGQNNAKPRPIFIVFDVMCCGNQPVVHLKFEERLKALKSAAFRTKTANRDMFDERFVFDLNTPLPLVRKNFVKRTHVDDLLQRVAEERGMRCYRSDRIYNHLTDGIIFQPNEPYVCGTDLKLLKWKYLDTMTIDIEILPLRPTDDDDTLRVGCLGEEQTRVDMTRHVLLPKSERLKLEADRFASRGGTIAEVGFDPETGEWYYLTMRPDKIAPNHIGTVLGTLLELGECLTTEELRFRLSVPTGQRDTYRKDKQKMLKQLLEFQRKSLKKPPPPPPPPPPHR